MQNKEEGDNNMWVYGGAALFIVAMVAYLWMTYGHRITNGSIALTIAIMQINESVHSLLPDNEWIRKIAFFIVPEHFLYQKEEIIDLFNQINPFKPSIDDLTLVWTLLGHIVRVPVIVYALSLSWKMFVMTRPLRMKRSFDIFSLARLNMVNSPHIRHAIEKEIHKDPINAGPHRQEEGCIRFAIIHGAVNYVDEDGVEYAIKFNKTHSIDDKRSIFYIQDSYDEDEGLPLIHQRCVLDVEKIRVPFREQITQNGVWRGFDELPRQSRALVAVFLLSIKGGKKNIEKAINLLKRYNLSYKEQTKKKSWDIDDSGIDGIIRDMENTNAVKKIIKVHYYNVTAIVGLYKKATARRTKMPPNLFYWIKEVDRGLWYALHQNLSPASWCEAGAVRSIEQVETSLQTPCSFPFVDSAVKAILSYLNDEGWLLTQPSNLKEISG